MAVKYEVCAVVGEKKDGSPMWRKFGAVFQTDKGFSLKLEGVPIAKDFDGWFKLFPPKEGGQTAPKPKPDAPFDDDLPF